MTDEAIHPDAGKAPAEKHRHREGYYALVWRRFCRSRVAMIGGVMTLVLGIFAVFADFFSPLPPDRIDLTRSFIPPQRVHFIDAEGTFHLRPFTCRQVCEFDPTTYEPLWREDTSRRYGVYFLVRGWEYSLLGIPCRWHLAGVAEGGSLYLLGTDKFGRDLWGRACRAGRISLTIALFATLLSVAAGSLIGIVSGYFGGWTDLVLQRIIEFLRCFPQLALWMALAAIIPHTWDSLATFLLMVVIFALLGWTMMAREIRGKVLALRETDFVLAAEEMGASHAHIIFRHLYPNVLSHVIVVLTLTIPGIILAESLLSFLGIGIQPPLISWGILMHDAQNIETLGGHPWIMSPVVFIMVAVLGFNFLGDGLRDAADPYAGR
jgi:peptide/nickel transport system permease protein